MPRLSSWTILLLPFAFIAVALPASGAAPGTFAAVGSMSEGRSSPTATLLADGTVLVAGGNGSDQVLSSAERFDPGTNSFTPVGEMSTPRLAHAAVRLQDGRVLVAGGLGPGGASSSVDVFDPETNQFTPVDDMTEPRYGAAAAVLSDGQVLIAGGKGASDSPLNTAEIFNPKTETFQTTGSMAIRRSAHALVTLGDGRVVVFGGAFNTAVEIYDPASGQFIRQGKTVTTLDQPAPSLLADGKILVADDFSRVIEVYDPATGASAQTGITSSLHFGTRGVVLADRQILMASGLTGLDALRPIKTAELVNPTTGGAISVGAMIAARAFAVGALLQDGRVLFVGGLPLLAGTPAPFASAEVYSP
jgi:hypothetical protein